MTREKTSGAGISPAEENAEFGDMGVYVHIPFCLRRCRYCGFFSSGGKGAAEQDAYVEALLREARLYRGTVFPREPIFQTAYLGGGTPTYLELPALERLLSGLKELLWPGGFAGEEFTAEANPGTLDEAKLALLRSQGVNRLSIGAQSFDDIYLGWLGRSHDAAGFERAWELARRAGFTNMNLDLMYGLKGQDLRHWEDTLKQALACRPEHISLYQVNIEEGTPLADEIAGDYAADEEMGRAQYIAAHRVLSAAGYRHYEISNYALPGRESRHNLRYWRGGRYLGLGAGAAGYLGDLRYRNVEDLTAYGESLEAGELPRAEEELLGPAEKREEVLFLGLRLAEGVSLTDYKRAFGVDLVRAGGEALRQRLADNTLCLEGGHLKPGLEGMLLNNEVVVSLLRALE